MLLRHGLTHNGNWGWIQLKLNTDSNPETATKYGIRSIPTVMLFKDGAKQESVIGAVQKAALLQMLEKYVS
jgi:thioredoxin 1